MIRSCTPGGRIDPDVEDRNEATMDPNERPELAARLRAAREAAYRRDAGPADVARLRALAAAPREASPSAEATAVRRPPRSPRTILLAAAIGMAVGAGCGLAVATPEAAPSGPPTVAASPPSVQRLLLDRVLGSGGTLTARDYYRFAPDDLPLQWGGGTAGRSHTRLHGTARLAVQPDPRSSAVLVAVACPAGDRAHRWSLSTVGGRVVHADTGDCGRLDAIQVELPEDRPLALRVDVAGGSPYSVSVLER